MELDLKEKQNKNQLKIAKKTVKQKQSPLYELYYMIFA